MTNKLLPGDAFPQLKLTTIQGKAISIPDGWTHLQFRRYAGCPICNLLMRQYSARIGEIKAAGIQEVAVFHSSVEVMLPLQGELPFDVIADPTKALYHQFGVEASAMSLLDPRGWLYMLTAGFTVRTSSKMEGGGLGLPANFLISPEGRVAAVKYGAHSSDHWSVDELLQIKATSSDV